MNEDQTHRQWIDGYCSGTLTEAEFAAFEQALREHPELRRELLETRMLDSDLRDHASGVIAFSAGSQAPPPQTRTIRRMRFEVLAMAAVIAVMVAALGILFLRQPPAAEEALDHGVAVLTRMLDAEWANADLRAGDSMAPGKWRLEKGTAELEFYSGASVILEAPAELEIVSESRGTLLLGKLRAQVPPQAHGFTITTSEIELVDLGTSFGMEVGPATGTAVHVFDGEVELFRPKATAAPRVGESLFAGDGRAIDPTGQTAEIPADGGRFLSRTDLDQMTNAHLERGLQTWRDTVASMRERGGLIAHYDFQAPEDRSRTLPNLIPGGDPSMDGSVIGATWAGGRWPGDSALDFKRPSDRVRIAVPGARKSMTLVAWVRIDGFDHKFSSLLLSDGWGHEGAVHWQIRDDARISLAIRYGKRDKSFSSIAPFPMQPSDFGRWMQLAVSYDENSGIVTHYRNGEVIGTTQETPGLPLVIGNAEIGNWTPALRKERELRNFNGRIDELIILERTLSPDEMATLYQKGSP
ncbi:LamG-like jellyroll fold domain-containing protein [Prosthecobacter sp.]|uniref:LamG-like jellyroll fold domain-containing protein n=1 Tax=Prosthecobacter sp. TaxID=1965333 RepID=UPI001D7F061C|nr:LamG-like jellyroll fold domain-containing protein [Prosthecobacter sp.]MCB1275205.1 FecR domain-containing protein [Prosthecobacter sp.]